MLCLVLLQDICKSLWCHRTGHRCETKFMPAAEGTSCGPDMVSEMSLFDRFFDSLVNPIFVLLTMNNPFLEF